MTIRLHIACNNPDNGMPQGWFDTAYLDFGDGIELHLEGMRTVFKRDGDNHARIGRRRYEIFGYGFWVGNWCWDVIYVSDKDATRIIEQLRNRDFSPNWGTGVLWDAWKSNMPVIVADVIAAYEQEAPDAS